MIHRRRLLFAAATLAAPAICRRATAASGARKLRLGHLLSVNSQFAAAATAMAAEVAANTQGRIDIQQFPNASLGGEVEMLKGVQLGTIDLAFISCGALSGIVAEVGVFNIPFLFDSKAHAYAVLDGPIGDSYFEMCGKKDLVALGWGENGQRHLTSAKAPVTGPEDLKGLRLRVPQSEVMLMGFRALGADVKTLPFPQLYQALQSGAFEAQENPIATILSSKFAQVQKFLSLTGHVYDPALMVMSPDLRDDLSPADLAIFRAAAKTAARASRAFAAAAETSGVGALQEAGMQVTSTIDRPRFAAAMAAAMPDYEKMFGAQRIADIRKAA